jgi:hypothetical protein
MAVRAVVVLIQARLVEQVVKDQTVEQVHQMLRL